MTIILINKDGSLFTDIVSKDDVPGFKYIKEFWFGEGTYKKEYKLIYFRSGIYFIYEEI